MTKPSTFLRHCIIGSAAVLSGLYAACSFAAPDTNQELPAAQVQQFVRSIQVIKHYYIKPESDKVLFESAIKGMVSSLDPHSMFLDKTEMRDLESSASGEFVGIGIELTTDNGALKVISPLEGTPADEAGIKAGDLIIKVDGNLIANMTLREAINHIKGKKGTPVQLTIIRKGMDKPLQLTVVRNTVKIKALKSRMLENGYGYIRIASFQGTVPKNLIKALTKFKADTHNHLKGLVLDLRSNPGGLLGVSAKVADAFLDSNNLKKYHGVLVYTKGRIPGSDVSFKAHPIDRIKGVPLVVLINGGSASASEIVAGALQDYKRAIIMGTRSFGKGSVQTVIPIDNDTGIKITTALYHTPSGRVIQARGIVPNVVVPPLEVKQSEHRFINVDESNYRNHLANGDADLKKERKRLAELKKIRQQEIELAKKDYQLYEALMMLKGMNALN